MFTYKPFSNPIENPNAPWWARTKKKLILKQTSQELLIYQYLKKECPKLRILPQKTLHYKGKRFYLDFYIPRSKLAIEVDGGYHLLQKNKDEERDNLLLIQKFIITLRFTNDEVDTNPQKVAEDILYAVSYYSRQTPFIYKETDLRSVCNPTGV